MFACVVVFLGCRFNEDVQACMKQVVADQCGNEIADALDDLLDRVQNAFKCSPANYKRRGD